MVDNGNIPDLADVDRALVALVASMVGTANDPFNATLQDCKVKMNLGYGSRL